jgi:LPPG:FO 2-phospho-L-lactate transferase
LTYAKARSAKPAPGVRAALEDADAILIAPSNPLVSIAPILAVPGIRQSLRRSGARVVAVSPLIGGRPVKGPAHRMMRSLGMAPNPLAITDFYADFLDGLVIDSVDRDFARRLESRGIAVACLDTLMTSPVRAIAVARAALQLARPAERRRTLAS